MTTRHIKLGILLISILFFTACGNNTDIETLIADSQTSGTDTTITDSQAAIKKIRAYAEDGLVVPTLQDYIDAGVEGVTEDNLDAINAYVKSVTPSDIATIEAIQEATDEVIDILTPPTLTLLGVNPQSVTEGEAYVEVGATATDLNDGNLTSSIVITGNVDTFTVDTYTITYRVEDSHGNVVTVTRTVEVEEAPPPVNNPPIADAGSDQGVYVDDSVELDGSGSTDPDGNDLTYAWSMTDKPADSSAALSDETTVNPTYVTDKAGVYIVSLVVNDGTADSTPNEVQITASVSNLAPEANASSANPIMTLGETLHLNGSNSVDSDGSIVSYVWTLDTNNTFNSTGENIVVEGLPLGRYTFTLTVTDDDGDTGIDTILIDVIPNTKPVADPYETTLESSLSHDFTLTGSDADNDPLTFSLVTSPSNGTLSGTIPNLIYTPNVNYVGVEVFEFKVNDGKVDSTEATVTLTVQYPACNDYTLETQCAAVILPLNCVWFVPASVCIPGF